MGCEYQAHLGGLERGGEGPPVMLGDAGPPPADAAAETLAFEPLGSESHTDLAPRFADHPQLEVKATIAAWRERYLTRGDVGSPDGARCVAELAALRTVVVEPEEFRRLCWRCDPDDEDDECEAMGRANACAPVDRPRREDGTLGESRPLNVIASTFADRPTTFTNLVIHETIHHLGRCTGDGMDHWHRQDRLWCTRAETCGEDAEWSVDARARALAESYRR